MALVKLDNSQYQNLVITTNSALNYVSKDNETKQREPKTAAISIIREAANVESMGHGNVSVAFKQYGQWQNYYLNKNKETGTITLRPTKSLEDRASYIYVNPTLNEQGKAYYAINEKSEAGRNFVQGLSVQEWRKDVDSEPSFYVEGRATLRNDELQNNLKEITSKEQQDFVAILSNDGIEIKSMADLQKGAKELEKSVDKEIVEQKLEDKSKKKEDIEIS